jgi:hypothetical protein
MRRREFITLLGGTAAGWLLALRAQEAGRKYRIAALLPNPRNSPSWVVLSNELQQFGFIESQNLTIDFRVYGHHPTDAVPILHTRAPVSVPQL